MHCNLGHHDQARQNSILATLDAKKKWALRRSIDGKISAWLTVLPHHFDLSATKFRDALVMRYQHPLILSMPGACHPTLQWSTRCTADVSLFHHWLLYHTWILLKPDTQMVPLPWLQTSALWQPQTVTLHNVQVVDTDAPSYIFCCIHWWNAGQRADILTSKASP